MLARADWLSDRVARSASSSAARCPASRSAEMRAPLQRDLREPDAERPHSPRIGFQGGAGLLRLVGAGSLLHGLRRCLRHRAGMIARDQAQKVRD
ncbi:hypothetical protein ACFQX4_09740 [Roseomonas sp. GCM10028921]